MQGCSQEAECHSGSVFYFEVRNWHVKFLLGIIATLLACSVPHLGMVDLQMFMNVFLGSTNIYGQSVYSCSLQYLRIHTGKGNQL